MADWGHEGIDCDGNPIGSWGALWGSSGPDHIAEAEARVIEQYKTAANLKRIHCIHAERWDQIDHVAELMQGAYAIDAAEGVQMDVTGRVLGLTRDLATDDDYRLQLSVQADLLLPQGRNLPNVIIQIIRKLLRDDLHLREIDFLDAYPLGYAIQIDDLTTTELVLLQKFLPFTRPAAYQSVVIFSAADGFVFDSVSPFIPQGSGYGSVSDPAMGGGYGHALEII